MKKLFIIVFLFSIAAWPQGPRQAPKHSAPPPQETSEMNSQSEPVKTIQTLTPNAGEGELILEGKYGFGTIETNSTPSVSLDVSGGGAGVSYFYGLDQNNSIGLSTRYSSIEESTSILGTNVKFKVKGFDNIVLGYKGNFNLGFPTLYVAGAISIPAEKDKTDYDKSEATVSKGQVLVPLSVGLVMPFSQLKFGGIATYQFAAQGTGEVIDSGTSFTGDTKGGDSYKLQFFGELENDIHPNFELEYLHQYARHFEGDGVTADDAGQETVTATFSLRLTATPTFELIPNLSYATLLHKSDLGYSKYDLYTFGLNARILF
jgi:hypothetical protein